MEPKFQVIIPVVNTNLADVVIKNMEDNSLLPERVIIIDNSQQSYAPHSNKFPIDTYHCKTGTVNESLNLGIFNSTDCDYISIFNDDIQIGSWFFRRVHDTFLSNKKCSTVCPMIIVDPSLLPLVEKKPLIISMKKREGCAMTFKKEIIDSISPIPYDRIKTFYGDDWFWLWTTARINMIWLKDIGNTIYHMVGQSILKFGKRHDKRKEREEWYKIRAEIERGSHFK